MQDIYIVSAITVIFNFMGFCCLGCVILGTCVATRTAYGSSSDEKCMIKLKTQHLEWYENGRKKKNFIDEKLIKASDLDTASASQTTFDNTSGMDAETAQKLGKRNFGGMTVRQVVDVGKDLASKGFSKVKGSKKEAPEDIGDNNVYNEDVYYPSQEGNSYPAEEAEYYINPDDYNDYDYPNPDFNPVQNPYYTQQRIPYEDQPEY